MWRLFSSREMVELLLVVGLTWMAGRVMTTFDLEPDSPLRTQPLEMSHLQEREDFNVRRTSTGHPNTIVRSSGIRAHDPGRQSPRPGRDGDMFRPRLSQRAAFLPRKKLHWPGRRAEK